MNGPTAAPRVILASASAARRDLLRNAGVAIDIEAARIDEAEIKKSLKAEGASSRVAAESLAELKALRIARNRPGCLVIGADQMLDLEGRWFDKPVDRAAAATQLRALSGRTHKLISALVVVREEARLWHHVAEARLTMRQLSDDFIEAYLNQAGTEVCASVGAYQLEGIGAQLFAKIEGDYFTILGLPLLPLLDFLRNHRVLAT